MILTAGVFSGVLFGHAADFPLRDCDREKNCLASLVRGFERFSFLSWNPRGHVSLCCHISHTHTHTHTCTWKRNGSRGCVCDWWVRGPICSMTPQMGGPCRAIAGQLSGQNAQVCTTAARERVRPRTLSCTLNTFLLRLLRERWGWRICSIVWVRFSKYKPVFSSIYLLYSSHLLLFKSIS